MVVVVGLSGVKWLYHAVSGGLLLVSLHLPATDGSCFTMDTGFGADTDDSNGISTKCGCTAIYVKQKWFFQFEPHKISVHLE